MAEASSKSDYLIGVDFGGTKIYAGVFDARLELVGTTRVSTKAERGPDSVIDRIARCVRDAADECDLSLKNVRGVGIGAPGAVDTENGRVIFAPNLGWKDVPLQKELEKKLELPVFLDNDCAVSMTGVYEVELKRKPQHALGIFIGTGIGGALVVHGQLYRGFNGTAGEVGHMVIAAGGPKCSCGNQGCFEALASRTALFRRVFEAVKDGQKTVLTDMLGGDLHDLRSGDLRKAIKRGDKFVEKIVEEAAAFTGIAVANLINILNPEVVVLGGGVIEALENEILPVVIKEAKEHILPGTGKGIEIVASHLGDNAGITGGAVLARRGTK